MFERDEFDHGYSRVVEREPWELTLRQEWQERWGCRKVEDLSSKTAQRCSVVEEGKTAHEAAHAQRAQAQAQMKARQEAQRAAFQQTQAERVRRSTPEVGKSSGNVLPRRPGAQAAPAAPGKGNKKKQSSHGMRLLAILMCILMVVTVCNLIRTLVGDWVGEIIVDEDNDSDFFFFFDDNVEEEEEDGDEEEASYALPAYEGDSTGLSVDLISSAGKQALTYQELYERCRPSMVSITVNVGTAGATGSGIVLTEDGYILTCDHVIDNEERCTVLTADGQRYTAQLVGADPQTDLAVLKINAHGLTPAEFGDSDELAVGDEALAIGDPLGETFQATLTNGIISGIDRTVVSNARSMKLIQTTAAVNSGNSGGALFNIYGQVVGVVNLKMVTSTNATVEGMGMAVPTTTVQSVVEQLAVDGTVHRPVLGITCLSISEDTAAETGLPSGLWVNTVNEVASCAQAGLEPYDIITEVNGVPLCTVEEFKEITADCDIGDTVTLTVYRCDDVEGLLAADQAGDVDYQDYPFSYYGDLDVTLMDSADMN
jgi:serine protease Do